MKKWSFLMFALIWVSTLSAQDQMILKSGTTMNVKILKSNPVSVDYRQPEIFGDSVLSMDKSEIVALVFENGYTEVIQQESTKSRSKIIEDYPANKVAIDGFGFLGRELYLHYERMMAKGSVSLRVPFGFIYNFRDDYTAYFVLRNRYGIYEDILYGSYGAVSYDYKNGFGFHTGLGAVVYFNKPKKVRGYFVPSLVIGMLTRKADVYRSYYDEFENYYFDYVGTINRTKALIGTDFKIGFNVLPVHKFSFAFETGAGYGRLLAEDKYENRVILWRLSVLLGFNWDGKKRNNDNLGVEK